MGCSSVSTVIWGARRETLYEESHGLEVFKVDRTGKIDPALRNKKSELHRRQGQERRQGGVIKCTGPLSKEQARQSRKRFNKAARAARFWDSSKP